MSLAILLWVLSLTLVEPAVGTISSPPKCTVKWATQFIDNFGWFPGTYQERYLVYDAWFRPGGPIFFYTGNEAEVTLYVNWTGLIWENAESFHALVVFAEHRFYGQSLPCTGGYKQCGDYLGTDQAMADYARLISTLRQEYPTSSATVAFGGSYGGMLSAWMRIRYPTLVDGAIASSAPIACMSPSFKGSSYWAAVTHDATASAGAAPNCSFNVNAAFTTVIRMTKTVNGRAALTDLLHLCAPLQKEDTDNLLYYLQGVFDAMAMGNYPFPTNYISGTPEHPAPAWPVREACKFLATLPATDAELVASLHRAIEVINNISGTVPCFDISSNNPSVSSGIWDFMVCTEGMINEQPYFAATGWPNDMFYKQPVWTESMYNAHCMKSFSRRPRFGVLNQIYGVENVRSSSNIVFANGLLDPWHSGGILTNLSSTLIALIIPEGAHHLDLFFSTPQDPPSVRAVRAQQLEWIRTWMRQAKRT